MALGPLEVMHRVRNGTLCSLSVRGIAKLVIGVGKPSRVALFEIVIH